MQGKVNQILTIRLLLITTLPKHNVNQSIHAHIYILKTITSASLEKHHISTHRLCCGFFTTRSCHGTQRSQVNLVVLDTQRCLFFVSGYPCCAIGVKENVLHRAINISQKQNTCEGRNCTKRPSRYRGCRCVCGVCGMTRSFV